MYAIKCKKDILPVMKIKKIISSLIYPACLFFTLLTLISQAIVTLSGFTTLILSFKTLIAFFAFSLLLSALNRIFYVKSMGLGLKIFLHYIGFLISFLVIFLIIISGRSNTAGALITCLILSIIYFIIAGIAVIIRHLLKKTEKENKKYENVFIGK